MRVASALAFLSIAACVTPTEVVRKRASMDLECPASDLSVTCAGGKVFHLHEQFHCAARGCAKNASYRCEAPLDRYGPFELLGDARCHDRDVREQPVGPP